MRLRRSSGPAVVLSLFLGLTGCSSSDNSDKPDSIDSSSPTTSVTPSATATPSPSKTASSTAPATPSETPSATPSDCPLNAGKAIPDGTWQGPITMRIKGSNGNTGYANSTGTGTLTAVVRDGAVKRGTWSLTWKSHGHADTGQAEATVTLDGKIAGKVKGTAAKPVVTGTWTITGQAKVIANGQTYDQPINEAGTDTEKVTIASASCEKVTGTFVPSFNSKETMVTFTGTARWTGSRVS